MNYTQFTDDQVTDALDVIGAQSIDDLFSTIPRAVRCTEALNIPLGLSEAELLGDTGGLAARNRDCEALTCFLGAGAYDHFVPTLVDALAAQTEFLTGYTPYQAEASQGILQLFFEFQTMVCHLTGMEVANASVYDVATGAAEAVIMAGNITKRRRVLVADNVHPDIKAVLRTYGRSQELDVGLIAGAGGAVDEGALGDALDDQVACVMVQSPNFFGCIERLDRIIPAVQAVGALVVVVTDPLAGGVLTTPGSLGADIVVAEGQPLGIPLQYGGPYLGLLATREKYLRKMPGRIVGITKDREGRRGFCLVLQTREQHIKRERATSNICTNQGLLAVRAAIYMAATGKEGIRKVASQCFDKAHYAADRIAELDGYDLRFSAPYFKEFAVRTSRGVPAVLAACRDRGILAGVPLGRFDRRYDDCFLVAVTEKRTKAQIDALVAALKDV